MAKGEIKDTDKRILLQLNKEDIELLDVIAEKKKRSRNNLLRIIIEEYLDDYRENK